MEGYAQTLFHPVISHLADLFGNEADHENNDRAVEEQGRHVGESALSEEGVGVVAEADDKEGKTDWQEHPKGRKQCGYLSNNEKKTGPVFHQFDFAFAGPRLGLNRDVFDAATAAQVAQSEGGGVRESVGQKIDELFGHGKPHQAETGSQVLDVEPGDVGGKLIVDPVGQIAVGAGFRGLGPRAHDHVKGVSMFQEAGNVFRLVLAVGVHHQHPFPLGAAQTGFNGGTVADVVGVRPDVSPGSHGLVQGIVDGTVVHHENFKIWMQGANLFDGGADDAFFIIRRQEDGDLVFRFLLHSHTPQDKRGKSLKGLEQK